MIRARSCPTFDINHLWHNSWWHGSELLGFKSKGKVQSAMGRLSWLSLADAASPLVLLGPVLLLGSSSVLRSGAPQRWLRLKASVHSLGFRLALGQSGGSRGQDHIWPVLGDAPTVSLPRREGSSCHSYPCPGCMTIIGSKWNCPWRWLRNWNLVQIPQLIGISRYHHHQDSKRPPALQDSHWLPIVFKAHARWWFLPIKPYLGWGPEYLKDSLTLQVPVWSIFRIFP